MPDEQPEPHILSAAEILAADDLERWEVPEAGITMIDMTEHDDDALMGDAMDAGLDDRGFAVRAVARQAVDPALAPEDVAAWDDERLLAALASLAAHDALVATPIDAFAVAAYRQAVKARYAALVAQVAKFAGDVTAGPLGRINESLAAMVKNQVDLSRLFKFGAGIEADKLSAIAGQPSTGSEVAKVVGNLGAALTVPKFTGAISDRAFSDLTPLPMVDISPSPNYAAETAGGLERIASFQKASIEVAAAQRDELIALNAKVETLTTQAGTTNKQLKDLVRSTTPRWVFYFTLVAAVLAVVVGVLALQPRPTAPAPAPIMTAGPSSSS